jgi:CheY-like chemotaxis protein
LPKKSEVIMLRENGPRVLVVDNVADATDSMVMLLELWGYDAEGCYDGAEALEAARIHPPRVVLLDLGMPKMDGFEVAHRLRAESRSPPAILIAVTGYVDQTSRLQAHALGFDHFLVKPAEPDQLRELLLEATGSPGVLPAIEVDEEWVLNGDPRKGPGPGVEIPARKDLSARKRFSICQ